MKKYFDIILLTLASNLLVLNLQAMEQQEQAQIKKAQELMNSYKQSDKISAIKTFTALVKKGIGYKEAIPAAQNGFVRGLLEQNKRLTIHALKLFQLLVKNIDTKEKEEKLKYIKQLLITLKTQNLDTPCIDWISRRIIDDWAKNI